MWGRFTNLGQGASRVKALLYLNPEVHDSGAREPKIQKVLGVKINSRCIGETQGQVLPQL